MKVLHGDLIMVIHVQCLVRMMMVFGVLTMYREMRHLGRTSGHSQWCKRRQGLPNKGYQQEDRAQT